MLKFIYFFLALPLFACQLAMGDFFTNSAMVAPKEDAARIYYDGMVSQFKKLLSQRLEVLGIDSSSGESFEIDYQVALLFQDAEFFCLDHPGEDCQHFSYWFRAEKVKVHGRGEMSLRKWREESIFWSFSTEHSIDRRWGLSDAIEKKQLNSATSHVITSSGDHIEFDFEDSKVYRRERHKQNAKVLFQRFSGVFLYPDERSFLVSERLSRGSIRFYDYEYDSEEISIHELDCEGFNYVPNRRHLILCDYNSGSRLLDIRNPDVALYSIEGVAPLITERGSAFVVTRAQADMVDIDFNLLLQEVDKTYRVDRIKLSAKADTQEGVFVREHRFGNQALIQVIVCSSQGCQSTPHAYHLGSNKLSKTLRLERANEDSLCIDLNGWNGFSCAEGEGEGSSSYFCQIDPNAKSKITCAKKKANKTLFFTGSQSQAISYQAVDQAVSAETIGYSDLHNLIFFRSPETTDTFKILDMSDGSRTTFHGNILKISRHSRAKWFWSTMENGLLLHSHRYTIPRYFTSFLSESDEDTTVKSDIRPKFVWAETGVVVPSFFGSYWVSNLAAH